MARRRLHQGDVRSVDILVNNAGVNIVDRHWDKLTPENIEYMAGQPDRCFVLRHGGAAVHASATGRGDHSHRLMAGRFIGGVSGPIYVAAKHGIAAMSLRLKLLKNASTAFAPRCFCRGDMGYTDPRSTAQLVGPGSAGKDGAAGRLRRSDPVYCQLTEACGIELKTRADPESRACRQPATKALRGNRHGYQ